jgi:DNA-binding MarR family transcriptional regulator
MKEEQRLALAFKRLIHIFTTGRRTPHEFGDTALYAAEAHLLEIIGENPGITATDIVNYMQVTKGAVSQIVSKLFRKGLVQKSSRPGNMKIKELTLTEKGMEVFLLHEEHERELMQKMKAELNKCKPEDISIFTTLVNTVADFAESNR